MASTDFRVASLMQAHCWKLHFVTEKFAIWNFAFANASRCATGRHRYQALYFIVLQPNEPIVHPWRLAYIQGGPSHYRSPEPVHAGVDSDRNRRKVRGRRLAQGKGAGGRPRCRAPRMGIAARGKCAA